MAATIHWIFETTQDDACSKEADLPGSSGFNAELQRDYGDETAEVEQDCSPTGPA